MNITEFAKQIKAANTRTVPLIAYAPLPSQLPSNSSFINHPIVWCHTIRAADSVVKYTTNNIIKQAKLDKHTIYYKQYGRSGYCARPTATAATAVYLLNTSAS